MSVDKARIKQHYPLPVYNYKVEIDDVTLAFSEVSGLSVEYEPVTYKHGMSFWMGSKRIPGMRRPIRLTLRRGIGTVRDELYRWFHETYTDPLKSAQREVRISLCDEVGMALITWKVQGALPIKIDAPAFDANSSEVAFEAIELIAQNVQITYNE
jgi:phage tail-like protein